MDIENVLEEYRQGDDGKRLSLFLAYRELREQFDSIDRETEHDDFTLLRFPWTRKHQLPHAA